MKYLSSQPIFISLSPNVEKDDLVLAFKLLFQPQRWVFNPAIDSSCRLLEKKFKDYFGAQYAFSFNSGRSAFWAILKALNFKKGDQILVQGFTCNALINPIINLGLEPVYVDIDKETLNLDPTDLERKITPKSKAVVVQHTFGLPAELDRIIEICKKHNLVLIEDCAHSLGAEYKGRKIGTFGEAAFFSFGRDKIISSVYGGMAICNDTKLGEKLKEIWNNLNYPSRFWVLQQLLHPLLVQYLVKPLYRFGLIGKFVLIGLQKTKILSKAVTKKEKQGKLPSYIPKKMPEALAVLALHQFSKLEKFNSHRDKIAQIYYQKLSHKNFFVQPQKEGRIYMRFPVILKGVNTDKLLQYFRRYKIFLNDGWRKKVIVPPDTNQQKMQYIEKTCPNAEFIAKYIVNLPTHINVSVGQAQKIVELLLKFLSLAYSKKK